MEPKLYEKRPGYWIIVYAMPGKPQRQVGLGGRGVEDEIDAEVERRIALKLFRQGLDPFPETVPWQQGLDEYLDAMAPPTNDEYTVADKKQRIGYVIRRITQQWPKLDKIGDLRQEHVDWYRDTRKKEASPVTVNKDLIYFAHAHKWWRRKGYASVNPFADFVWLPEPKKRLKEKHDLAHRKLIVQHAEPHFRPAIMYAYQCGCRLTEVERTTLGMIDLERRVVVYPKTKRGAVAEKSFHASAYLVSFFRDVILIRYIFGRIMGQPAQATDRVFLNARGWPINLKTLRTAYLRTAEDAGLVELDEARKVIVSGSVPKLRATRHTFGSAVLRNSKLSPQARRDAMDHSNFLQLDQYATADSPEMRAAFETMDVDSLLLGQPLDNPEADVVSFENYKQNKK
jgi:integrase